MSKGKVRKSKGEEGLRTATEGKAQRQRRNGQQWKSNESTCLEKQWKGQVQKSNGKVKTRLVRQWNRKAQIRHGRDQIRTGTEQMGEAVDLKRISMRWNRKEQSCIGVAQVCSAKEVNSGGKGKAMYGNGIEYQRIVVAMNGLEQFWKSYEGRLFATEMPLQRL